MPNMSYCRWENTLSDLLECQDALGALINGEDKLSDSELAAAKRLVQACGEICRALEASSETIIEDPASAAADRDFDSILDKLNEEASDEGR